MHKRRILVTGASGLIGKQLLPILLGLGYEVLALSRQIEKSEDNLHWIKADFFNQTDLELLCERWKPEILIHLAWITTGDYLHSEQNYNYLEASMQLVRHFVQSGGKRLIVAGTCFEYLITEKALAEDAALDCEKTVYTFCKNQLHEFCRYYAKLHKISFAYARIFYAYGQGEAPSRLLGMLLHKLTKGEEIIISSGPLMKDYIYTKDIARALALIAQHTSEGAFNIGSGQAVSIREFSECVAKQLNASELLNFQDNCKGQAPLILADTSRIAQELGFKAKYTLDESIKEVIQDYNDQ